jgi:hypothetical protein
MKYVLIGWAVILVIFLIVLSTIPIGKEPLTELYFENHTTLPATARINATYPFSFVIHNLEYEKVDYNFIVAIEYGNKSMIRSNRSVELGNNQTARITSDFKIAEPFTRARIAVSLANRSEAIHFWVDEINST